MTDKHQRHFDFKIETDGGEIQAHKFLLIAHSGFFKTCLHGKNDCNDLSLKDIGVPHVIMKKLIDYMYLGKLYWKDDGEKQQLMEASLILSMEKAVDFINNHQDKGNERREGNDTSARSEDIEEVEDYLEEVYEEDIDMMQDDDEEDDCGNAEKVIMYHVDDAGNFVKHEPDLEGSDNADELDGEMEEMSEEESQQRKKFQIPQETLKYLRALKQKGLLKKKADPSKIKRQRRSYGPSILIKYRAHDEEPGLYVCPWEECTFRTRHTKNVYVHERTHTGEKPYACNQCEKTFISNKHLSTHAKTHTDERPFSCSDCGKCLRTSKHLERHMLCHTGEKPFKCAYDGCTSAFKDKINLKKHISLLHEGQKPYECNYPGCKYVAYDQHGLKRHQKRHLDHSARESEVCTICGKRLYGQRSIKSHMLLHNGEQNKCPYCDYTSVFKQGVLAHCMRKHGKDMEGNKVERKYQCSICSFSTFWQHDLNFHIAKHTGLKPFKCPICEYETALKGSLQKHMRLHTGETPFTCTLCGKAYTNQSALARHKRTHTGEKPHSCDICGKRYADLKTMRAHRFLHVNWRPYMCSICKYSCVKKDVLAMHLRKVHGQMQLPQELQPRPHQRVMMRVTSGQTAHDIISNIVPEGKGERQVMRIGHLLSEEGSKFMIVHEEDDDNDDGEQYMGVGEAGTVIDSTMGEVQHGAAAQENLYDIMTADDFQPEQKLITTITEDGNQVLKVANLGSQLTVQNLQQILEGNEQALNFNVGEELELVDAIMDHTSEDMLQMPFATKDDQLLEDDGTAYTADGLTGSILTDGFSTFGDDSSGTATIVSSVDLTSLLQQQQLTSIPMVTSTAVQENGDYVLQVSNGNMPYMLGSEQIKLEPLGNGEYVITFLAKSEDNTVSVDPSTGEQVGEEYQ